MFVAAFAHACLYGYKVMYPTEALPETVGNEACQELILINKDAYSYLIRELLYQL